MALMPKRVKHRKSQRGRIKGNATRGNKVVFGDFGLQSMQAGWIKAQTIEAGRIAAQQYVRGEGRLYVRIFPHRSITSTPLETRMGKGKGEPEHWVATVKPGTVLVRVGWGHRATGTSLFRSPGAQNARAGAIRSSPLGLGPIRRGPLRRGRPIMKANELREMSDEQLGLTLTETVERLFRLRMQAQTERLDAPSEIATPPSPGCHH